MLQDTEDKRKERRKQKVCLNNHKHRVLAPHSLFIGAIGQGAHEEQWGCVGRREVRVN